MKEKTLNSLADSRKSLVNEINRLNDLLAMLDYEIECITSKID